MIPTPVLTRAEVYVILDSERAYQDRIAWPENAPSQPVTLTIGEELLTVLCYLEKAQALPPAAALEMIRKIAAMGVRALENQGLTREEAYSRIDAAYAKLSVIGPAPVEEALSELARTAIQARDQWLIESRPELKTLALLTTLTALGVQVIENHGCPARKVP